MDLNKFAVLLHQQLNRGIPLQLARSSGSDALDISLVAMAASQEERELERFALAPQQQRTKVLQELPASGTTPHAAFLQGDWVCSTKSSGMLFGFHATSDAVVHILSPMWTGLHAAHNEDLSALEKACEQLKQMLDGGRCVLGTRTPPHSSTLDSSLQWGVEADFPMDCNFPQLPHTGVVLSFILSSTSSFVLS